MLQMIILEVHLAKLIIAGNGIDNPSSNPWLGC